MRTSLLLSGCLALAALVLVPGRSVQADFITINMKGFTRPVTLQGKVTDRGQTVTYKHPTLDKEIVFPRAYVVGKIIKCPTPMEECERAIQRAGRNADKLFDAAIFCLRRGRLRNFNTAIKKAEEADPNHEGVRRILAARALMERDIPESMEEEREIKRLAKRDNLKIARSKHFILAHDTPDKAPAGFKKPRAQHRLDMLEEVYHVFIYLFIARGVDLDIPNERLRVVLFNNHDDYLDMGKTIDPSLKGASGFYVMEKNFSVFYDHSTDETFKMLKELVKSYKDDAEEARRMNSPDRAELKRQADTIELYIRALQEERDITVVTHECAHQLAGNTGLLPRYVRIPSWAHEGLATYFESPKDAGWSGVGAVNEERLDFYKLAMDHPLVSGLEFVVTDQMFDRAANHTGTLVAYGQAWALTHFLMETRPRDLVTYYRLLGEIPPQLPPSPELLWELFRKSFGDSDEAMERLELDWRGFMRNQKTDYQRLKEEAEDR
jgi:hypothetical protein